MVPILDLGSADIGLVAQSVLNTVSNVIGPGRAARVKEWFFSVRFGAGTSAGVVTVEASDDPNDANSWASVGTMTWTAANKTEKLNFTGALPAVRLRISTAIVGGTVTGTKIMGRD